MICPHLQSTWGCVVNPIHNPLDERHPIRTTCDYNMMIGFMTDIAVPTCMVSKAQFSSKQEACLLWAREQVWAYGFLLVHLHGQDSSTKEGTVTGHALHRDCQIPFKCAPCGHLLVVSVLEKFDAVQELIHLQACQGLQIIYSGCIPLITMKMTSIPSRFLVLVTSAGFDSAYGCATATADGAGVMLIVTISNTGISLLLSLLIIMLAAWMRRGLLYGSLPVSCIIFKLWLIWHIKLCSTPTRDMGKYLWICTRHGGLVWCSSAQVGMLHLVNQIGMIVLARNQCMSKYITFHVYSWIRYSRYEATGIHMLYAIIQIFSLHSQTIHCLGLTIWLLQSSSHVYTPQICQNDAGWQHRFHCRHWPIKVLYIMEIYWI